MPKLTIDNCEIEVPPGTSVKQACEMMGIEIPHFCQHNKLSVPANCRMCLVEIEKIPKPVPSCAQACNEGMVVHTDTPAVHAARKSVMQSLLINHPLDCPVCDQGGECDLQDQAMAYGADRGLYKEEKRVRTNPDFGPLIKTNMTRCINCTRCVRFVDEIAGTPELSVVHRGEHAEITHCEGKPLTSELSGNAADICPTGALTAKPYAFRVRPWELRHTESVDVSDAVGSNIRIDTRGNEVMRILPRANDLVNEDWISDKARFAFDGLKYQRLDRPYVREDGKLREATWDEALATIAKRVKDVAAEQVAALAGNQADCESMFALKLLMKALGSPHLDCRQDGARYDITSHAHYVMNSGIAGIEEADALLLIGTDPRWEAPLVNTRIRKRWLQGGLRVGLIGALVDLGYPYQHVGTSPSSLADLAKGRHAFSKIFSSAKKPMMIVGAGALARPDGVALHAAVFEFTQKLGAMRDDWNGFNVLQNAASRVGGIEIGFLPQAYGKTTNEILKAATDEQIEIVYLLGADEVDVNRMGKAFVVYQGHHGDKGAARADVILPGAAYTEKNALYANTEGRPQLGKQAVFPPGEAKEDWQIIRALADALGKTVPFDALPQLRSKLIGFAPRLGEIGRTTPSIPVAPSGKGPALTSQPFANPVDNFYMTDVICRASPTMAKCVAEILPYARKGAA